MFAQVQRINQILTETKQYKIPVYQRPYSWGTDEVIQFITDLHDSFMSNDDEYFIGSLITIERETNRLFDVVDGQQRLTTLNLIFASFRDAVSEKIAKTGLGNVVLPVDLISGDPIGPRLMIREKDQTIFLDHILGGEPISDFEEKRIFNLPDVPKRNLIENFKAISKFINEEGLNERQIRDFAKFILGRVSVVFITASERDSAVRLFKILNARGMQLSNADLIKNNLFEMLNKSGNASSADENKLDNQWLELEEKIGIEDLDQVLAHHRSSVIPIKAKKTLFEEYETMLEDYVDPFKFLNELKLSADYYTNIMDLEFEGATIQRALQSLQQVKFEDWIPPLLAFLKNPTKELEISDFIENLEKITYQNWICRLAPTARLTVYYQLVGAIKENSTASAILEIFHKNSRENEFISFLEGDVYGKPFTRAVLFRLEDCDKDESVTRSYNGLITIEHILPQSLNNSYWSERFTEDEHKEWVHRLGNLALLSGRKNYKAQNSDFETKKQVYNERNNVVSFETTKMVSEKEDWNLDCVQKRQKELLDRARKLWSIYDF